MVLDQGAEEGEGVGEEAGVRVDGREGEDEVVGAAEGEVEGSKRVNFRMLLKMSFCTFESIFSYSFCKGPYK